MKLLSRIFAGLAAFLLLTACPNVDPKPDPDPTPTPKPDVTVSLGTARIGVDSFLDDALKASLEKDSDDSYRVASTGDPFSVVIDIFKDYDAARPFRRYWNYPVSYNFQLGAKPEVPAGAGNEIDLTGILPATYNLGSRSKSTSVYFSGLPDGILSLEGINLTPESRFELTLSMVNPFFTDGTMTTSFAVDMRKFFGSSEAVDGELKFDAELTPENGYKASKVFHLSDVAFNPENFNAQNHNVRVDARIVLSGVVKYDGMKTTRARLNAAPAAMELNATVVLYDLTAESITGQFDYKTRAVTGGMKFQSGLDALGVDFDEADVLLGVDTDLSHPFDATVALTGKKNRVSVGNVSNIVLPLPVAEPGGSTSEDFNLNEDGALASALSKTPDELAFSVTTATRPGATGTVFLGKQNTIRFTPSVSVPLRFGERFDQTYSDTLSVPTSVGEALATKSVELLGQVANQLPMDAEMSFVLLDGTGRALTRPVSAVYKADSQSDVKMTVSATGSGAQPVSKAAVTFRVHGVKDSRPVKASDALSAQLSIKIPGDN